MTDLGDLVLDVRDRGGLQVDVLAVMPCTVEFSVETSEQSCEALFDTELPLSSPHAAKTEVETVSRTTESATARFMASSLRNLVRRPSALRPGRHASDQIHDAQGDHRLDAAVCVLAVLLGEPPREVGG